MKLAGRRIDLIRKQLDTAQIQFKQDLIQIKSIPSREEAMNSPSLMSWKANLEDTFE